MASRRRASAYWCGSQTMICKGPKVYNPRERDYNICPSATVYVETEVKRKPDTGKTLFELSAKLVKINLDNVPASDGVQKITEMAIKLYPKGELADHCDRPTTEPHLIPTYHDIQRVFTCNFLISTMKTLSVGWQMGTTVGTKTQTFRWSSAPSTEKGANFRWEVLTFENGAKIAPGRFHFGSLPKLPIPKDCCQLVDPTKSFLCKASWDCEFRTNECLQKVVLGVEVELHSTIFRQRRLGVFYSVVSGHIFKHEQDLTFKKSRLRRVVAVLGPFLCTRFCS